MARDLSQPVRMAAPSQGLDGRTTLAKARAPLASDGRVGDFFIDTVAKKLYGPKSAAGWPDNGLIRGAAGWYPLERIVNDGARRVVQVYDWAGGEGVKPATGYKTATGAVSATIGDGVDMRGASGPEFLISAMSAPASAVSYASLIATGVVDGDNELRKVADLFIPGAVMSFASLAAAQAAVVPVEIKHVALQATADGTGAHRRRRVDAEPDHAGKHRSADRFTADGGADAVNGGWWEIDETVAAPEMIAASGNGGDDTATVNGVIGAAPIGGAVQLSAGKAHRVGASYANPRGIALVGPGELLQDYEHVATPSGPSYREPGLRRLDTYARKYQHAIGHEHLWALKDKIQQAGVGSGLSVLGFHYGDSNTDDFDDAPDQLLSPPYRMVPLFARKWRLKGLNAALFNTNRGAGGQHIGQWDPFADIGPDTKFMTVQFGINEGALYPALDPADYYCTKLLEKLKAVREWNTGPGAGYGSLKNLSIILMSPAACSRTGLMDARWQENLRGAHEEAVNRYGVFFFDAYAKWWDSYLQLDGLGGGLFMEDWLGEGSIHSKDIQRDWILSGLFDEMFPDTEMDRFRGNNFTATGSNTENLPASTPPSHWPHGHHIHYANGGGWPLDGTVHTLRSVDDVVIQHNYAAGSAQVRSRVGDAEADSWGEWAGTVHLLGAVGEPAFQNGWVNFGAGMEVAGFSRSAAGTVTLQGLIKSGTTAQNTLLFTLPAGFRPAQQVYRTALLSSGAVAALYIATNGEVRNSHVLDATWTSLTGISFPAG